MKRFLLLVLLLAGCEAPEIPTVNLPPALRQHNYERKAGNGSCVYAAAASVFRWQHQDNMADYIVRHFSGGTTGEALIASLNKLGVRFSYTLDGDESWLEWACMTRRGCVVDVPAVNLPGLGAHYQVDPKTTCGHAMVLVYLDATTAGLLDNNDTARILYVDRDRFMAAWHGWRGFAITPVYTPAAPLVPR